MRFTALLPEAGGRKESWCEMLKMRDNMVLFFPAGVRGGLSRGSHQILGRCCRPAPTGKLGRNCWTWEKIRDAAEELCPWACSRVGGAAFWGAASSHAAAYRWRGACTSAALAPHWPTATRRAQRGWV